LLTAIEVDDCETPVTHDGTVEPSLAVRIRTAVTDCGIHSVELSPAGKSFAGSGVSEDETAHTESTPKENAPLLLR
jgi:hypothetical protein